MKSLIKVIFLLGFITFISESDIFAAPVNTFINNVSPGINAINAGSSENIIIYFSQDMNPSTVNNSGIIVSGNETGMIPAGIIYNAADKTAVIDPVENFKPGDKIYVNLNSNVKTAVNVSIDPFLYTFRTDVPRGDGNFSSSVVSPDVFNTGDIVTGDYDGDGILDLISFKYETHTASFLKNNGLGIFSLINTFFIDPIEIKCFTTADYDNDGDLDLAFVIGEYMLFDIQIFLNNGSGTFTAGFRAYMQSYGRSGTGLIKSYDIDNDGDIDILPGSNDRFSGRISILLNNGNAAFTSGGTIQQKMCFGYPLLAGRINNYEFIDVNNDGSMDAILESFQLGYDTVCQCDAECYKLKIAVNNGHGVFTELISYSLTGSNSITYTGDFNNDGYNDIICSGLLLKNNGNGYFTSSPLSIYSGGIAGDFEADGDLDIITHEGNSVNIYKNNGDATFSPPVSFVTDPNAGGIRSGSFDKDCDLDIVFGNNINNDITVLLNSSETNYCSLTGSDLIPVNTENNLYTTSDINGYWEILNVPPCNAFINGNNEDDSVLVNSGLSPGEYILYHHSLDDCGWKSCSKTVNVDHPTPVEIASFVSAVNRNNVTLIWTTSSEMNNSGFDIEQSSFNYQLSMFNDQWDMLGSVRGNGTSSTPKDYEFTNRDVPSGKYIYRLKQIDYNGNYEYYNLSDEVVIGIPEKFELSQNYPNPFNPFTNLEFGISNLEFVSLKVYDIAGKEVTTLVFETKPAGRYQVKFDGSNFASGVYYYKITAGNFNAVKKMILMK